MSREANAEVGELVDGFAHVLEESEAEDLPSGPEEEGSEEESSVSSATQMEDELGLHGQVDVEGQMPTAARALKGL